MSCSLGRVCGRCVGFHNVDIIGTKAHKDIAPVIGNYHDCKIISIDLYHQF